MLLEMVTPPGPITCCAPRSVFDFSMKFFRRSEPPPDAARAKGVSLRQQWQRKRKERRCCLSLTARRGRLDVDPPAAELGLVQREGLLQLWRAHNSR